MNIPTVAKWVANSVLGVAYFFVATFLAGLVAGFVGTIADSVNGYAGAVDSLMPFTLLASFAAYIWAIVKHRGKLFITSK